MSQQINLFNPIFLKQKKIFAALPMVEALGIIIVGALLLNWYAAHNVAELEHVAADGKAALAKREQQLVKANAQFAPRAKDAVLQADLAEAEAQLKALSDVSAVLQGGALGNTSGYAEYFRAFSRQNIGGLWLTGVSISGAGTDIGLQGRAMQATLIPNYISRLTGERVMHGKTFASLDIARPEAMQPQTAAPAGAAPAAPVAPPFVEFNLQSTPVQEAAK
nr:MSHA biogenesis protein MshI [uncultured Duganella sp.]